MLRFVFRFLAVVCLAIAVMFAVMDATRSVGVSALVLTPLVESWTQFFPDTLTAFSQWLNESVHPFLNDPVLATLLVLPTSLIFVVLCALLYIIGYKRRRRSGYFVDR